MDYYSDMEDEYPRRPLPPVPEEAETESQGSIYGVSSFIYPHKIISSVTAWLAGFGYPTTPYYDSPQEDLRQRQRRRYPSTPTFRMASPDEADGGRGRRNNLRQSWPSPMFNNVPGFWTHPETQPSQQQLTANHGLSSDDEDDSFTQMERKEDACNRRRHGMYPSSKQRDLIMKLLVILVLFVTIVLIVVGLAYYSCGYLTNDSNIASASVQQRCLYQPPPITKFPNKNYCSVLCSDVEMVQKSRKTLETLERILKKK